jgi:hypothetical protein
VAGVFLCPLTATFSNGVTATATLTLRVVGNPGVPLAGGIIPPTFGKVDASMDSKYIYKKIEVDPDEPVEETTTTEPTITKITPDDASK